MTRNRYRIPVALHPNISNKTNLCYLSGVVLDLLVVFTFLLYDFQSGAPANFVHFREGFGSGIIIPPSTFVPIPICNANLCCRSAVILGNFLVFKRTPLSTVPRPAFACLITSSVCKFGLCLMVCYFQILVSKMCGLF